MVGIKQILLILGVFFLIRIIGRVMTARRNINEQDQYQQARNSAEREKERARQNYGKTSINRIDKRALRDTDYAEFEEIE